MKIKALETLASKVIADNKEPDLFFVSTKEDGVVLVSRDFDIAHKLWKSIETVKEPCLENRTQGVICDISPLEGETKLRRWDASEAFLNKSILSKFSKRFG